MVKCYIWSRASCGAENLGTWESRSELPCISKLLNNFNGLTVLMPISVAALSKAWVCGRLPAEIWVRIPSVAWTSIVSVVCCQVEVSASG